MAQFGVIYRRAYGVPNNQKWRNKYRYKMNRGWRINKMFSEFDREDQSHRFKVKGLSDRRRLVYNPRPPKCVGGLAMLPSLMGQGTRWNKVHKRYSDKAFALVKTRFGRK